MKNLDNVKYYDMVVIDIESGGKICLINENMYANDM